jgi:hypothetical protein
MNRDGQFDIAYQNTGGDSTGTILNLARYSSTGVQLSNGPILDGNFSFDKIRGLNPSVAMDNAGNAVVAYQIINNGFGPGGNGGNVFDITAIRVSSTGTFGNSKSITTSGTDATPVNNVLPPVALASSGGSYVVAWNADFGRKGGAQTVEVAEVTGSNVLNFAFILPAAIKNVNPALSIADSGTYLLTYDSFVVGTDRNINGRFGKLPVAPAAQNLALTSAIRPGQSAVLTGQLFDGDGDTNLTLTVNWGDGSLLQQSKPGTKPFAVAHQYVKPGTYTVHATWTDSTGLSNSRDLTVTVK